MISKENIEKIKDAMRIEEVVGDFVQLKKRGVNMLGLCPFHNEKTPSFTVSPAKGIYKCFGCSEAGTAIDFVMKHEHYTYPQALKYLAGKYSIEVEEVEQSAEQIAAENEREGLYSVSAYAQKYYQKNLESEEGKAVGLSYFRERGYNQATIDKFQLGYATADWDELFRQASIEGYKKDYLVKTGLCIEKEDKVYDRFRQRVIFPIHNISGRVLGFGARILISDKNQPKYVNSPESDIYNKSEVLYGIFFAKNSILKKDNCFLVEGYTDVISMHLAGIENVVSSSGTSLTIGQIKLIKRFTNNITILYDGDAAGIKASFRGIDMIVEEGMNVRIVLFPDGEDPDSFSRSRGSSEVQEFIQSHTQNFITFKSELLSKEAKGDPVKQAELVKDIVQTISLIPDQITRLFYVRECSAKLDVQEQVLINEVNKFRRKKYYKESDARDDIPTSTLPKPEAQIAPKDDFDVHQERELLRLLINYGKLDFVPEDANVTLEAEKNQEAEKTNVAQFLISIIDDEEISFNNPIFQEIIKEYVNSLTLGIIPGEQFFVNHSNEEIKNTTIDLLTQIYTLSPNYFNKHKISVPLEDDPLVLSKGIISALYSLKIRKTESKMKLILDELKANPEDEIQVGLLQKRLMKLKAISNQLNLELGRIVAK